MCIHVFTHSIEPFFPPQFKKKAVTNFSHVSYLISDIHIFWSQSAEESTAEFFPFSEGEQRVKNRFDFRV